MRLLLKSSARAQDRAVAPERRAAGNWYKRGMPGRRGVGGNAALRLVPIAVPIAVSILALVLGGCGSSGAERVATGPPVADASSPPAAADASPAPDAAASYAISGYVVGVTTGAVVLRLGGELLTLSANRSFTFAARLPDKASYSVAVEADPPGELCTIANGSGTVAEADVVTVAVTCLPTDAQLASLTIAPGTLTPAFAPTVTSYAVSVFHTYEEAITVTAVPATPGAVVNIAGVDVEPGTPTELSLSPGTQTITLTVTAPSGAAQTYSLAITRTPVVYFKPSNPQEFGDFGRSLSISGGTFVVGAYGDSSSATGVNGDQSNEDAAFAGAAYVFTGAGQSWHQQAYLKASNTGADDQFGNAVAIDGDTIAIGAPGESSSARGVGGDETNDDAPQAGAVYIFERTGEVWAQTAYLKASNADAGDFFGGSVALQGDTLLVGAYEEGSSGVDQADNSAPGAGAVYVFERQSGAWTQTAYLKASNAEAGDLFGVAVALDGDTLVVGASAEASIARGVDGDQTNNDATDAGAAYVFQRSGGTWTQIAYLKASNNLGRELFGSSVAVSADTIVVGAPDDETGSTGVNGDQDVEATGALGTAIQIGAAYVFVRQDQSFVQQAFLKPFGSASNFGTGVGISGDTVVVAATTAGYSYFRSAGAWAEQGELDLIADDISVGFHTAIDGDEVLLTNIFDGSGAAGIDPPPSTLTAYSSGGVYLFQ
jgi:hypothetical protein